MPELGVWSSGRWAGFHLSATATEGEDRGMRLTLISVAFSMGALVVSELTARRLCGRQERLVR